MQIVEGRINGIQNFLQRTMVVLKKNEKSKYVSVVKNHVQSITEVSLDTIVYDDGGSLPVDVTDKVK